MRSLSSASVFRIIRTKLCCNQRSCVVWCICVTEVARFNFYVGDIWTHSGGRTSCDQRVDCALSWTSSTHESMSFTGVCFASSPCFRVSRRRKRCKLRFTAFQRRQNRSARFAREQLDNRYHTGKHSIPVPYPSVEYMDTQSVECLRLKSHPLSA